MSGVTKNTAITRMVAQGYTEDEAKAAWSNMQNLNFHQVNDTLDTAIATGDLKSLYGKEELDQMVANNLLTRENADAMIKKTQDAFSEAITTATKDDASAKAFLDKLDVTVAEGAEIGDVLFDTIDELYAQGRISEGSYEAFYTEGVKNAIEDQRGDVGKIAEVAAKIVAGENVGPASAQGAQLQAVADALRITKDGVKLEANKYGYCRLNVGHFCIDGERMSAPPVNIDQNKAIVKEGNCIYAKNGDTWYRFTSKDFFEEGEKILKLTQEQRDAIFVVIGQVLGGNQDTFRVLNSSVSGVAWEDKKGANIGMMVDGNKYDLDVGDKVDLGDVGKINAEFAKLGEGHPKEGDAMVFNGRVVVVTSNGELRYVYEQWWNASSPYDDVFDGLN